MEKLNIVARLTPALTDLSDYAKKLNDDTLMCLIYEVQSEAVALDLESVGIC